MSTVQLSILCGPGADLFRTRSHHERGGVSKPEYERAAAKQDEQVLAWFRANPGAWGPSQVWRSLGGEPWGPLTSCRRAMSNLAHPKRGELVMTEGTRMGAYGRQEHLWRLA